MATALTIKLFVQSITGQIFVMAAMLIGMCFTWPTLEAMASEGETSAGIQKMVGIYNVIWAGTGALADFTGGMMLDKLGLRSIFYVSVAIFFIQLVITFWLAGRARYLPFVEPGDSNPETTSHPQTPHLGPLPIGWEEGM